MPRKAHPAIKFLINKASNKPNMDLKKENMNDNNCSLEFVLYHKDLIK